MARKNCSEEFRRAVDLYESTPGATVRGVASDLGIVRGTLRGWLEAYGTGKKTAPDGTLTSSPLHAKAPIPSESRSLDETQEQRIARLEAENARLRAETTKLSTEREILQRAAKYSPGRRAGESLTVPDSQGADNSATYEVKRLCELLEIERSSYYAWKAGAPAREQRAAADAALAARIRVIHGADNTLGAPRVTAELNDAVPPEERVNHKRVARVMRGAGITGYVKRRRVRTTIPDPSQTKVPDLLKRGVHRASAEPPLRRRHHLPSARRRDGSVPGHRDRLLLTPPRRLGAGRSHAHQPRRGRAARCGRGRGPRELGRGDLPPVAPGVYCSKDYARLCAELGVTRSMGAVGTSADNALAESFNAALNREVLQDAACWTDALVCRRQLFRWLTRYNTKRRHSWCRYQSPNDYERSTASTLALAA